MGAYMYPIIIKREPQVISFEKSYNLGYDSTLTLAELKSYGVTEDNSFRVVEENGNKHTIYIYCKRMETEEEVAKRVAREEKYMEKYREFHKEKVK